MQPSLSPSAFLSKASKDDDAAKLLTSPKNVVTVVDSKQRRSTGAKTLSSEVVLTALGKTSEITEKDGASSDVYIRSVSASPEIPIVAAAAIRKTREKAKSGSRQRTKTTGEAAAGVTPDLSKFLKTPFDKFGFQSDTDEVPEKLSDYRIRTRSLSTSSATDGHADSAVVRLRQIDIRKAFAPDAVLPSSQQKQQSSSPVSKASERASTSKAKNSGKRQPLRVNFDSPCRGRTRTRKTSSGGDALPPKQNADKETPKSAVPAEHVAAVTYSLRKSSSSPVVSPKRSGGDGVSSVSKNPSAASAICSPGQSRNAATDDSSSSAKSRLFSGSSPKKTVTPVDALPLDDDRPSSCSQPSAGGSSRKRLAPKSPAPCDTTVRRSARLSTKVSADDCLASSQAG